jgi:D-apionolactonase
MMQPLSYDGTRIAPPERLLLYAGVLSLEYESGTLRWIRLGEQEILRGIYVAIRDQNWGSIPGVLRDTNVDIRAKTFDIRFTSEHRQNDISFVWRGTIKRAADNTILFEFHGEALTTFKSNRIGFCVLHPGSVAGMHCIIEHADGRFEGSRFPLFISSHQPYLDIRAIQHEVIRVYAPRFGRRHLRDGRPA